MWTMATRCGCSWSTRSGCSDSRPVPKGPVVKAPGLLFVSTSAQVAAEQARGQAGNRASRIFFVSPPRANPFSSRWIASPVKRNQKTCPCIRTWRPRPATSGPLTPSSFQGHALTGHPWPGSALATSMSLSPLHDDSAWPPEGALSPPYPTIRPMHSECASSLDDQAKDLSPEKALEQKASKASTFRARQVHRRTVHINTRRCPSAD
ncbi:hypothetical protein FBY21_2489 [Pseudomonas sp. SLBN-26]|nr:hypothetical protein [Pseudomonas otitidis]TQL07112.1 hypothetical protein FBY21_2489 [Pseudomonas sp. SLBN-26]